jgi:hypothetical protein
MSWNIRRSTKLGPFRLNLSKSGIGWSVGVRGARIGRDAKGRTYTNVSIPGTGIYNRQYYKPSHTSPSWPIGVPPPAKICPHCGSQWASAATRCTSCDVPLIPMPGPTYPALPAGVPGPTMVCPRCGYRWPTAGYCTHCGSHLVPYRSGGFGNALVVLAIVVLVLYVIGVLRP